MVREQRIEYQEGLLVCHPRNFIAEVAEGERYVAASPSTDRRTALFSITCSQNASDRATPASHLSITSLEILP